MRAGIQRWVADAGPLLTLTLTSCKRNVVKCAQNLSYANLRLEQNYFTGPQDGARFKVTWTAEELRKF